MNRYKDEVLIAVLKGGGRTFSFTALQKIPK